MTIVGSVSLNISAILSCELHLSLITLCIFLFKTQLLGCLIRLERHRRGSKQRSTCDIIADRDNCRDTHVGRSCPTRQFSWHLDTLMAVILTGQKNSESQIEAYKIPLQVSMKRPGDCIYVTGCAKLTQMACRDLDEQQLLYFVRRVRGTSQCGLRKGFEVYQKVENTMNQKLYRSKHLS